MNIILTLGVIVVAYLAALIIALISKKKPVEAFNGGSAAWIIVYVISLVITLDTIIAISAATVLGIVIQTISQTKDYLDKVLEDN